MSRAERLLELLQVLRQHRAPVTGHALAETLGISIRTLYRDIATLQGQGAQIEGEPGLGYVLRPGFLLPPLMLSIDEIEALVLGSRWVAVRGDARLGGAARSAVAKIRSVLPADLRDGVDAATLTVPVSRGEPIAIDASIVRAAIRREHRLDITYAANDGSVTSRTIWPLLIGFFDKVLILAAWCELRQDFRAFRLDRILSVTERPERYPQRRAVLVKQWRASQNTPATAEN